MAYSSQIRAAVGAVRESLAGVGVGVQNRRFTQHGEHDPLPDAPLVLVACSGGRDSISLAGDGVQRDDGRTEQRLRLRQGAVQGHDGATRQPHQATPPPPWGR